MGNPIGGVTQASQKMVEELQKQAQHQVQQQQPGVKDFQQVMNQQAQGVHQAGQVQQAHAAQGVHQVQKTNRAVEVLKAAKAKTVATTGPHKRVDRAVGKGFRKLLSGIVEGQDKLDAIIKLATSGKKFNHQQLLAIQASVYKYSQELELTSKVVEKATSGVRQTMQTQV